MEKEIPTIITDRHGKIHIRTDVEIDTACLNEALLMLPAKTYLGLFREMHSKIYGYPPIVNVGGCCGSLGDMKDD